MEVLCRRVYQRSAVSVDQNERKAQKAGVVDEHEVNRVDLHPSLAGSMQESFQSMPCGRAVCENVNSTPHTSLFRQHSARVNDV